MEGMEWEDAKENVQPLSRGRQPVDFCVNERTIPDPAAFEEEIELYGRSKIFEDDADADPLSPWIKYIRWMQEKANTVSALSSDQMIEVLQRCCSEFAMTPKYANDPRFLRVFVRYADMASDPLQVFRYMASQGIGQELALYFEALAVVYESRRNYVEAGATYESGVRKRARPVERLVSRHQEFKARMVAREERRLRRERRRNSNERVPLTDVVSRDIRHIGDHFENQSNQPEQPRLSRTSSRHNAGQPRDTGRKTERAFKIYSDTIEEIVEDADAAGSFPCLLDEVKENRAKATPWTEGAGIVDSSHAVMKVPAFLVHEDEVEVKVGAGTNPEVAVPPSPTMTINTRNAIADFETMVNAPLPFVEREDTTLVIPIQRKPEDFTIYEELPAEKPVQELVDGIVDPFAENVRLDVETLLTEWYSANKAYHMISEDLNPRRGSILHLGSSEEEKVELCVQATLGKGRYATVYLVETISAGDLSFSTIEDEDAEGAMELALKVQKPSCPMEFYICTELAKRVPSDLRSSIVRVKAMFESDTSSYLLMSAGNKGTLQDLLNLYRTTGQGTSEGSLDETLVMFFAIELLRILDGLHSAGFIHSDIKPDNLLVRFETPETPLGPWEPNGVGGWNNMGLVLIDFGRALDVSLYGKIGATKFRGDHGAETFGCLEMTSGQPWSFQADTYAVAATVYLLLTGRDMKLITSNLGGKLAPEIHYKRYWKKDLWSEFFDRMLNLGTAGAGESVEMVRVLRSRFEEALLSDEKRARSLKGLVVRMGILLSESDSLSTVEY
uniref:Protein kinase domain-containing protein n=1 Tax=Compsopogon caeruleus TaxID=31354 RepID=A0A7S1XHP9_9RHOD|mmetsp:Transcript_9555/g.19538  ORF Transcript_9555/g.19538 Transcript_9555/m.19538 type:complete len:787 (+) Transcript_9555:2945-5305(+)